MLCLAYSSGSIHTYSLTEGRKEGRTTGKIVPSHPMASLFHLSHPSCVLTLPWQEHLYSENFHSRENSHHVALEAPTYPCLCFFIAENTESSEAAEGGIYFCPKQKRVGDSVGRDGNSWIWCGWIMPGGAQNFLCFVGGWGRLGSTEVSLKHSEIQERHRKLLFGGRTSTEVECKIQIISDSKDLMDPKRPVPPVH